MDGLKQLQELLNEPRKIVITTHQKPDGDAIGSSLGLMNYLNETGKGHQVTVISPTDYAHFLHWMPGNDTILNFERKNKQCIEFVAQAEIIFCLDFNRLERINDLGELVKKSSAFKVLIDHHLEPDQFADLNFLDQKASSTAELIYDLVHLIDESPVLTKEAAVCLYVGIMTDTGSFRFPATSSKVHHITGDLIEIGVDVAAAHSKIYDSFSEERMRFFGYCTSEKMQIIPELGVAYIVVTAEEIKRFKVGTGDSEGLVNYPLSIQGIKLSILIVDRSQLVKFSFRSKGDFAVNEFAEKYFEGGGHKNAAGGRSVLNLEDTVKRFLEAIEENKELLKYEL